MKKSRDRSVIPLSCVCVCVAPELSPALRSTFQSHRDQCEAPDHKMAPLFTPSFDPLQLRPKSHTIEGDTVGVSEITSCNSALYTR